VKSAPGVVTKPKLLIVLTPRVANPAAAGPGAELGRVVHKFIAASVTHTPHFLKTPVSVLPVGLVGL
jgi:hypothetical protein